MTQFTKSLNLIDPYLASDGKKYAKIPRQPQTNPVITNANYTVNDKSDTKLIISNLEKYGVVIVKNFLSSNTCDQIIDEVEPFFFRDQLWNGSPFPRQTTVVTRTVLKSPTVTQDVVCNPLFLSIASNFLDESNYFWINNKIRTGKSTIQLNSGITYKVGPGASDQMYHREDMVHHNVHKDRDHFVYGDESMVGLTVALTKTTKENGATRVIPLSHLYGPYRHPEEKNCNYIELDKGDAAFILGSTYHAASANNTDKDRISSFFFMTKSYLKQEENYFVDQNADFFKNYSVEALSLLGLNLSEPFCGHLDYGNPLSSLKSEEEINNSSLKLKKDNYGETIYVEYN